MINGFLNPNWLKNLLMLEYERKVSDRQDEGLASKVLKVVLKTTKKSIFYIMAKRMRDGAIYD